IAHQHRNGRIREKQAELLEHGFAAAKIFHPVMDENDVEVDRSRLARGGAAVGGNGPLGCEGGGHVQASFGLEGGAASGARCFLTEDGARTTSSSTAAVSRAHRSHE